MIKYFIVLALLGLVLLLAGCTQQTQFVCADGKVVNDKALCTITPATAGTSQTTPTPQALSLEQELSVCAGMPSVQSTPLEDSCIIGIAGKRKDSAVCREVVRDQRVGCYTIVAEVKNDPSICTQAESMEERCYEQYARDKKDASVCELIKEISTRDNCYSSLASQLMDGTLCAKIKILDQKDNCYFQIAQRLRDTTYCDKITSASMKENCQQNLGSQGPSQRLTPMK